MAKKTRPYPNFIVDIKSGEQLIKYKPEHVAFADKLKEICYVGLDDGYYVFKKTIFDAELTRRGFRRPTKVEKLLFDKE